MTEFYFKEKGVQHPAGEYFNANLKEFEPVLIIIKKYLNKELDPNSQPTEINFVKYPYLGDELYTFLLILNIK